MLAPRIADQVGSLRIAVRVRDPVVVRYGEPISARNRSNPAYLPATDDLVQHSGRVAHHSLSVTDREFVQVAEDETMADVEIRVAVFL